MLLRKRSFVCKNNFLARCASEAQKKFVGTAQERLEEA